MATSVHVQIGEYLNTSYRPDRAYVDGELLELKVGKNELPPSGTADRLVHPV